MKYTELRKVDVSKYVEKKNGLTYLSWAWAVDQLLQHDPAAQWEYAEPKMFGHTMMVFCTVNAFGVSRTAQLPVMNHRNQAVENPDSFQVNTAIMRCMTKCLALHGLGLYIYAGEDLPEQEGKPEPEKKPATPPVATPPPKIPAKAEGEPGRWQITIKAKPDATPTDWVNLISEAAVACLEQAESQADCMKIYQVNRTLFDKLKTLDAGCHKDLLEAFKTKKDSFQ